MWAGIAGQEELIEKINELNISNNLYVKIILIGEKKFEIQLNDIMKNLLEPNIIKVKDKTKFTVNLEGISKQNSLKGIFVKNLLEKREEEPANREKIEKAIEIGLGCF